MVRPANVARSRACQQCKRKRIKCDLHNPCHRCIESNLTCSGPVSGPLLVNTSASSFSRSQPRNSARPRPRALGQQSNRDTQVVSQTPELSAAAYDDGLLWNFLNYFSQNAGGRSWNAKMPALVTAKNSVAMKAALRAVSLAYAARNTCDQSMQHAACEFYGNSLRYHQFSFKAPTGKDICKKKAFNALPVTVLLSYFEMIQATSPDAWLKHTLAAERLFALLGPGALDDELLNHLYFIVRANSAIRCLLFGAKTQLLEQSWSEVNLQRSCGSGTPAFHSIIDLILWLCSGISIAHLANNTAVVPHEIAALENTINELIKLWEDFGETINLDTNAYPLLGMELEGNDFSLTRSSAASTIALPPVLQDPSAALSSAFFHAAVILLFKELHLKKFLSQSTVPFTQTTQSGQDVQTFRATTTFLEHIPDAIRFHSSQILAITQLLRTQSIGCCCVRMLLPIAVVRYLSPSSPQQMLAEASFRDWSTSDGLPGVGLFAFGLEGTGMSTIPSLPVFA